MAGQKSQPKTQNQSTKPKMPIHTHSIAQVVYQTSRRVALAVGPANSRWFGFLFYDYASIRRCINNFRGMDDCPATERTSTISASIPEAI